MYFISETLFSISNHINDLGKISKKFYVLMIFYNLCRVSGAEAGATKPKGDGDPLDDKISASNSIGPEITLFQFNIMITLVYWKCGIITSNK